ncbi:MAG: RidA family protein [Leadbetterella sp.]|nr:RidA family protein [Leadbetterella sp.]
MTRQNISSGSEWERKVGYSRAVRLGNIIELSGTVASDNSGELVGADDEYLQTKFILMRMENTLSQLGASLADVVRTRIYCTNIKNWQKIGKAHSEFFGNVKPASSMVEVSGLIHENYLVEIEATVILKQ